MQPPCYRPVSQSLVSFIFLLNISKSGGVGYQPHRYWFPYFRRVIRSYYRLKMLEAAVKTQRILSCCDFQRNGPRTDLPGAGRLGVRPPPTASYPPPTASYPPQAASTAPMTAPLPADPRWAFQAYPPTVTGIGWRPSCIHPGTDRKHAATWWCSSRIPARSGAVRSHIDICEGRGWVRMGVRDRVGLGWGSGMRLGIGRWWGGDGEMIG